MRNRCAPFTAALAVLALLALIVPASLSGQAPAAKAKAWTPPRTPDGAPDLQGFWSNATVTPLERPKGLGAKEFYTEEEFAEVQKRELERAARAADGPDTEPGTDADVHYDFAQFGLDRGQSTVAWNRRTSIIVGPEGTIPPQLPEARQRNAALQAANRGHEFDGPENRPLAARCVMLSYENVPMLSAGYNNNIQIVQAPGYVVIMHEMNHSVRIIPTGGLAPVPDQIRQWRGSPRGRWEGDTLVVENANFNSLNPFRGSSDQLQVEERFTLVDADTIRYQFTVKDPATWDKPWSGETAWSRTIGPIYEFGCHEGNYGLANTLRGARVAEASAAAKK
jgi:hypothetical protein